jgi:hypothetical protein
VGNSRHHVQFRYSGSQSTVSILPISMGRPLIHGWPGLPISITWERNRNKDWEFWDLS